MFHWFFERFGRFVRFFIPPFFHWTVLLNPSWNGELLQRCQDGLVSLLDQVGSEKDLGGFISQLPCDIGGAKDFLLNEELKNPESSKSQGSHLFPTETSANCCFGCLRTVLLMFCSEALTRTPSGSRFLWWLDFCVGNLPSSTLTSIEVGRLP